jgi:two-component system, OmpR family, response regulator QseB
LTRCFFVPCDNDFLPLIAMKLLLAEDDTMLGTSMEKGLIRAGFTVDWVRSGNHAQNAIKSQSYDAVLLDLGLPGMDGLALLKSWRQQDIHTPVLIVTARDAVRDRVAGLNLGADDYLPKPFDLDELVARIHALTRRHAQRSQSTLKLGRLSLDPLEHRAAVGERDLALSPREFKLLQALMEKPGHVLSIEQLEERLYGWEDEVASNAIEVHLHNLRRKLAEPWVRNVRGVGYKVVVPD